MALIIMVTFLAPPSRTVRAQAITRTADVPVDTWQDRPWTKTAGHLNWPADVTSLPDGRTVILDTNVGVAGANEAVHVFAPSGLAESVVSLPDAVSNVRLHSYQRIDGSPDGTLAILAERWGGGSTIVVTDIQGHVVRDLPLPQKPNLNYNDVAVAADGRFFASAVATDGMDEEGPKETASIVVLTPDGAVEREVDVSQQFAVDHGVPGHGHILVTGIDVASDGRLFAVLHVRGCG